MCVCVHVAWIDPTTFWQDQCHRGSHSRPIFDPHKEMAISSSLGTYQVRMYLEQFNIAVVNTVLRFLLGVLFWAHSEFLRCKLHLRMCPEYHAFFSTWCQVVWWSHTLSKTSQASRNFPMRGGKQRRGEGKIRLVTYAKLNVGSWFVAEHQILPV